MAATPGHKFDTPARSEAEQRAYFDAVMERTLLAEARAGAISRCYDVAGVVIRLLFAGPTLEALLTPALAHLEVEDVPPAATFHIWDSASTGTEMLPPPCGQECFTERGDIWGLHSERTRIAYHWADYSVAMAQADLASCIYWVADADCIPYWGRASPLRTLFHWAMRWHGRHLLHAAAIGTEAGAVLITGKGGVGKSTTALACLADGMMYVGDEYVVVELDPAPRVISLYATAKLNADQIGRFPCFGDLLVNGASLETEKAVLQLFPRYARQIARALPLRAVLTPEITGGRAKTDFAPVEVSRLMHAASFTTVSQLPQAGRQSHVFIERLVAALPGMTLRLGADLAAIPGPIRRWLDRPAAPAEPQPRRRVPTLSIVIPVYNGADFLPGAVASILAQGWEAPELIVVDDGSEDAIEEAVRALPIEARLFRQSNCGPAEARNRGIRNTTGELIAFLDVDDLWPQGRLAAMLDELERHPDLEVVQGHAQVFRWRDRGGEMDYIGNPGEAFRHSVAAGLFRRAVFDRVGLFDPDLRYSEDVDWFNRAGERGVRIGWLPMVTLLVQRHDRNMTLGKSLVEVNKLRVFKKLLDRKRELEAKLP
jgi:hypothetical protein